MAEYFLDDPFEVWSYVPGDVAARIPRWIEQSERLIITRIPTIPARVAQGTMDPQVVADVVEQMVSRAVERTARGGMDKLAYPEVTMEWDDSGGAGRGSLLFLTLDELMLLTATPQRTSFTLGYKAAPRVGESRWR